MDRSYPSSWWLQPVVAFAILGAALVLNFAVAVQVFISTDSLPWALVGFGVASVFPAAVFFAWARFRHTSPSRFSRWLLTPFESVTPGRVRSHLFFDPVVVSTRRSAVLSDPWWWAFSVLGSVFVWFAAQLSIKFIQVYAGLGDVTVGGVSGESSVVEQWLVVLFVVLLAPVSEELMFRGIGYTLLRTYLPASVSMVVSALVFGVVHGNVSQFIIGAVVGLLAAALYEVTVSIVAPILLHVLFNLGAALINLEDLVDLIDVNLSVVVVSSVVLVVGLVVTVVGIVRPVAPRGLPALGGIQVEE